MGTPVLGHSEWMVVIILITLLFIMQYSEISKLIHADQENAKQSK